MQKRDDSVRALKQASIGTDKPTRDKLKAAAAAAGMPLSEYLRYIADRELQDQQIILPGSQPSPLIRISRVLDSIDAKLDALIVPHGKRSLRADLTKMDATLWHALGLNSTPEDIALLKEIVAEFKQRRLQAELRMGETEA